MAEKELFWLGVGVICIDGKDYGAGTPLPVSKIDKGNLKKMKKDGRIGGMIEKIEVGCKDCTAHLDTIQAKNSLIDKLKESAKGLAAKAKEAGNGSPEELETANGKIEDLEKDVKEKSALIDKLTKDLDEATKPKE